MAGADILKGLLAVAAGGLTGYAEGKKEQRTNQFKQQMKDMELQVRMENIRRMTAEDSWQRERSDFQNKLSAAQAKQTTELTQPKVDLTNAQVGLTDARADHIPVAEKLAQMLGDSLVGDRKARNDDRDALRDELRFYRQRLFGDPGGEETPYGAPGARIDDATGKVERGSGSTSPAKLPIAVREFVEKVAKTEGPVWFKMSGEFFEEHPEYYSKVMKEAHRIAGVNKKKDLPESVLMLSPYFKTALEDAMQTEEAKGRTIQPQPILPPGSFEP